MTAPLLARLAGLDASAVLGFASPLGARAEALHDLRERRDAALAALAEGLHALVPAAEREERRFLLALRRDCHNARPLARHRAAPGWRALDAALGAEVRAAEAAEDAHAAAAAAFTAAYAVERERQRARLHAAASAPAFRRALALASPDLVRSGIATPRAEGNLLRYLSRAAVKLSPFSALTRAALAGTVAGERDAVRLAPDPWDERSLVRVRPYLLEKCAALLFRHPAVRPGLRVVLNGSLAEPEPGRFLFLRPSRWAMEGETFAYHPEALARAGLSGPLVRALLERLPGRRPTLAALAGRLARLLGAPREAVGRELEALLEAGFLVLLPPWRMQEGHAEAAMLRWMLGLPSDPALDGVRRALAALVALEEGFAAAADPLAAVGALDAAIDRLWEASARLGGIDPAAGYERVGRHSVYEDVVVGARRDEPFPAAVQVDAGAAGEALASARPLVRAAALFDHRTDWLAALDAFARARYPEGEVPLVQLFHEAQPLWRRFLAFRLEARRDDGGWRRSWNPFDLPGMEALAGRRERAARLLAETGEPVDGEWRIDPAALDAALGELAPGYGPFGEGAALFLQDAGDGRWVLNRLKEGTGRFASRFTPAMDGAWRRELTRHLRARGRVTVDGEEAELLDLRCVQGDTLNVHARQTPRVLTLPGAEGEAPARARVPLGALRVRFGPAGLELRDAAGRRLVPVQLGFAFEDYLPPLVKFLAAFGPSELSAPFPPQRWETRGSARVGLRTRMGNLLLHRAAWNVDAGALRAVLAGGDGAEAFVRLQGWRRAHGVPARCFVLERSVHPRQGERASPQYLDLTSPLFVDLLRAALRTAGERLVVAEALPDPAGFPEDAAGSRWAVEVLVDSLSLRPATCSRPPRRRGAAAAA